MRARLVDILIASAIAALVGTLVFKSCDADAGGRPGARDRRVHAMAGTPDAGGFDALPADAILLSEGMGQSNFGGVDNDGGSSSTDTGLRASDAGITVLTEVGAASNETPTTRASNYFRDNDSSSRDSCSGNAYLANTAIAGISQGTTPYNRAVAQMNLCASYAATNRTSEFICMTDVDLGEGENDEVAQMSAATYSTAVGALYTTIQADFPRQCLGHIPLFQTQHAASTELSTPVPTAETAIGAWLATTTNPRICVATPLYNQAWLANSPHMTATSACWTGCYIGKQRRKYVALQQGCLGLVPDTITAANNVITMCAKGGDGPSSALTLDTTAVAQRGHAYGFYFTDSQTDTPAISSVAVNGTNNRCIDITLTRNVDCTATPQLAYADYGIIGVDPGGANAQTIGGNVRDSSADTCTCGGSSRALYNWLANFRAPVTSCTGSAQAYSWANTHSLGSNDNAANLVSARSFSDLNGAANASWCMWLRADAATWPTTAEVVWQRFQGSQNQYDFRTTATAGSLRMFHPTSTSDGASHTTCTGFVGQTWTHVCFAKSGTTLTVFRNGVDITAGSCTLTGGSVPATLTSPTRSPHLLLSTVGAGTAFDGRDFGVWTRALNVADSMELYCGSRSSCGGAAPTNPALLSTGPPVHNWPMNNSYEDNGSGTAVPLTSFAAGMTFSTSHP